MRRHEYMITRVQGELGGGSGVVFRTEDRKRWLEKIRKEADERGVARYQIGVIRHEKMTVCCLPDTRNGFLSLQQMPGVRFGMPKEE